MGCESGVKKRHTSKNIQPNHTQLYLLGRRLHGGEVEERLGEHEPSAGGREVGAAGASSGAEAAEAARPDVALQVPVDEVALIFRLFFCCVFFSPCERNDQARTLSSTQHRHTTTTTTTTTTTPRTLSKGRLSCRPATSAVLLVSWSPTSTPRSPRALAVQLGNDLFSFVWVWCGVLCVLCCCSQGHGGQTRTRTRRRQAAAATRRAAPSLPRLTGAAPPRRRSPA